MVGGDYDRVRLSDEVALRVLALEETGLEPAFGDEGVDVGQSRAEVVELVDDREGRGFAGVADVFLVGDAQDENLGAHELFFLGVEAVTDEVYDMGAHVFVDEARLVDEARDHAELLGPVGEVERVQRDAVAADAGARVMGHEAEGLGCGRVYGLPGVDAHALEDQGQLVDEGDVRGPEDVFDQFRGFCGLCVGDLDDGGRDYGAVELCGYFGGEVVDAAHYFGGVVDVPFLVAGVDALGAEGEAEVGSGLKAHLFYDGADDFLGGAGIRGGFEDDECAFLDEFGDELGRGPDVRQVGLVVLDEGRRDADDIDVIGGKVVDVVGREEGLAAGGAELVAGDVVDVGAAGVEVLDFRLFGVEAGGPVELGEGQGQRQADVAQAENADTRGARLDFIEKGRKGFRHARRTRKGRWLSRR